MALRDALQQSAFSTPPGTRREALMTAMTYASIAAFAVACVAYVVVRYVLFPRRGERVTRRA
ncbi:MAG: hypothetical protein AAGI22_14410 [Planctomycetota bacterium]